MMMQNNGVVCKIKARDCIEKLKPKTVVLEIIERLIVGEIQRFLMLRMEKRLINLIKEKLTQVFSRSIKKEGKCIQIGMT